MKKEYFSIVFILLWMFGVAQQKTTDLSLESQEVIVETMIGRASTALQLHNLDEVEKILSSALDVAKDPMIIAKAKLIEANFLLQKGEINKAQEILDIYKSEIPENSEYYTELLLVQADIHLKENKLLAADGIINTVELLLSGKTDEDFRLRQQFLKAQLYQQYGKNDESRAIYQRIIPGLEEREFIYNAALSGLNLAKIQYELEDYQSAKTTLQNTLAKAQGQGFQDILTDSYQLNSNVHKQLGEFEQALVYQENYARAINSGTTDEAISPELMELLSRNKQLESQIELVKQDIDKKNYELKGRGMSSILLFILLTLLSLLTMSLFKNNKLRARSNLALEGKNSALIDERDRAQDSAQIKADFLSTITHELRTPMYAVTGLTHLLLESEPRNDQQEHLETLQSSGEYLLSLIDNILDFNKLEANKVELEKIPFDLKKRVEDITISLRNQSKENGNVLNLEFDPTIPSRIKGDPVKISQILINLMGNAIKFTKNGTIWLRVDQVKQIGDRCLLHFEIEDNGKGISIEKQSDIFNNFTQEGSSTTREYGGTGLGLAIVKNLVTLMESEIKLDSKVGRGSIFSFELWFDLPDSNKFYEGKNLRIYETSSDEEESFDEYKKPERSIKTREDLTATGKIPQTSIEPTTEAGNSNQKSSYETGFDSSSTSKDVISLKRASPKDLIAKKILIVEDNKINQMITRKILEGKNFECDIANNGIEALGKIRENGYDLILMDIHMPGMDGKQCTREVRKFDRELPIIALTAVTVGESEKEFYEIGFDDIIPKPFKMEEFFDKIQKAFTNYQVH